jgi:Protein of unknown function (DUF1460)
LKKILFITSLLSALCCKQNAQSLPSTPAKTPIVSIGDTIIKYAKLHIGKPYIFYSLDKNKEEELVVNYDAFDCTTFVESVIAQAINVDSVHQEIRKMRYRNGFINGYASRIHYFTEWILENERRDFIRNVTDSLSCAKPYDVNVYYMSHNKKKYPLITNDSILGEIKKMESHVSETKLKYIPESQLNRCDSMIHNGDIIAITTNKKGLDLSHLGFAYWKEGKLHMIHASSDYRKVVITQNTLQQYLLRNKAQTGIVVLRLQQKTI